MTTLRSATLLSLATTAVLAATTTSASATSIIGFGNSAINNTCTNLHGSIANGATTNGPGSVTGLLAALPISGPANQCGNLGLPTEEAEEEDDGDGLGDDLRENFSD